MKPQNNYYEISNKGGIWTAKVWTAKNGERYQCSILDVETENLMQYGPALMTTNKDGKHDLYLPTKVSRNQGGEYDYNVKLLTVLTDIVSYQYVNGIFLLQKDNYCTFISPESFTWYLSGKGLLEGRVSNLPRIYCHRACILNGFDQLCEKWICRTDEVDYLVRGLNFNVYGTASQFKIVMLGHAYPLSGNTNCFKVTNEKGQYIHRGYYSDDDNPDVYHSIIPFSNEDYPILFPKKEGYYGYWGKDSNENILGMYMLLSNEHSPKYEIIFKDPVKSIMFVNRYSLNKTNFDVWKIIDLHNKEKILLKSGKDIIITETDFS